VLQVMTNGTAVTPRVTLQASWVVSLVGTAAAGVAAEVKMALDKCVGWCVCVCVEQFGLAHVFVSLGVTRACAALAGDKN
jgi:hypothetical protein